MDQLPIYLFTEAIKQILLDNCIVLTDTGSERELKNTLGVKRSVPALLYPQNLDQVQHIVALANKYKIALYTVSQGKNIGYGEMTPTGEQQVIMSLKYLNVIREYDAVNGEVVVEPGVTQGQLAQFLKAQNAPFCADVTGASPEASIIGNTMEAGFGHTPLGDHRKHILSMEVVLPDGRLLNTQEMPCIGPDLSQLFVQSNFGIVTALRIPLFRIPQKVVSFSLSFETEDDYLQGILVIRKLRQQGVINSLVHSGNATRTLMTSQRFPQNLDPSIVLDDKASREILCQDSWLKFGSWNSFGGVYGFKAEVREKLKLIRKAFKGIARVRFFDDDKIKFAETILQLPLIRSLSKIQKLQASVRTLKSLHGLLLGQPTHQPSEAIYWRVRTQEQLGLAWHAPVIPATDYDAKLLLSTTRPIFKKYGLEMPITMTLINHKQMTVVFNINFDKTDPIALQGAHRAYKELSDATLALGYHPYRLGLLSDAASHLGAEKYKLLQDIKRTLDPNQILSPGRYGIGSRCDKTEMKPMKDFISGEVK